MLTPTYLPTKQSEEYPWAAHTLSEPLPENASLPSQGVTQFWGRYPSVASFVWQSNKAILFYVTQNSDSEI